MKIIEKPIALFIAVKYICMNQNLKYIQRSTRYMVFVHVHLHDLFIIMCF